MTDVDRTLRAHADAAATATPDPDAWDHLVARLADVDATPVVDLRPRPSVRWLAVAAALAGAALVMAADGDEQVRPAATTAPTPTTAPPTTAGPGQRPEVDLSTRPDRIVAIVDVDADGWPDLARIEGFGQMVEVETPDGPESTLRDPEVTILVPGSGLGRRGMTSLDVGPDDVAYVATGAGVRAYSVGDGRDLGPVAGGSDPAVSGDGRRLATRNQGIDVTDLGTGEVTTIAGDTTGVSHLSWSTDGTRLARQRVELGPDGGVVATHVEVAEVPEGATEVTWEEVERSNGVGLPAFMDDGSLAVALGTEEGAEDRPQVTGTWIGMADLDTGRVRPSVGMPFVAIEASPDGRWVVGRTDDGVLRAFAAVDGWLWDSGSLLWTLGAGRDTAGIIDVAW